MSGPAARRGENGLRLGVLGCGWIANLVHLPELAHVRGVRVTALADTDAGNLERARVHAREAACFTDYGELLERAHVDAVVICLPDALHADACERAFAAGKHVYVEKPLAEDLDDAERAVAAWRASGLVGMVGFNYRFDPAYQAARRALRDGVLGRPFGVRSAFSVPARERPAWQRERLARGVLLNLASHHADLVQWLLDREVESVSASVRAEGDGSAATVHLRLAGGVPVQSLFAEGGVDEDVMEIYGERGKVRVDRMALRSFALDRAADRAAGSRAGILKAMIPPVQAWRRLRAPLREPSFRSAFEAFAAAVRTGRSDASPDLLDGFRSLAVVTAAMESAETGRPVEPRAMLAGRT
jgi:myo-inositol 2-dehydrogenase / D-chiro-inositol 1-dehydrogenase